MSDSDRLWNILCSCGDDHTIRQGGSHINLVQLKKMAEWPYLASINFWVPGSERYPFANAVVWKRRGKSGMRWAAVMTARDMPNISEYP